jgi:DNA-binding NarL/FixJ family response regulator
MSENGISRKKGPVAVIDGCPAYCRGLAGALAEAGFTVQQPDDVLRWAGKKGDRVVTVTVEAESGGETLRTIASAGPDVQLVALLTDPTTSAYRQALFFGACGVVGHDDPLAEIVETVGAAVRRRTLLPRSIAFEVASTNGVQSTTVKLSDQETQWIRALARGATVTDLADQVGYSERELYRLLKRLYAHLGVEKRSEALVRAGTLGLVD